MRSALLLRDVERILVLTGAGVSADSGLPTYRGVGGLYRRGPTQDGYEIEEILSGTMWRRRPGLVWRYIRELALASEGAEPNAAHRVIAELEDTSSTETSSVCAAKGVTTPARSRAMAPCRTVPPARAARSR